jgi:hypothetical protein
VRTLAIGAVAVLVAAGAWASPFPTDLTAGGAPHAFAADRVCSRDVAGQPAAPQCSATVLSLRDTAMPRDHRAWRVIDRRRAAPQPPAPDLATARPFSYGRRLIADADRNRGRASDDDH